MSGGALPTARALRTELVIVAWEKRWQLLSALLVVLALVGLIVRMNLAMISAYDFERGPLGPPITANLYRILILVAFAWPVSVWGQHPAGQRDYFWSLPIDQARHERLRVLAGGILLLAYIAVAATVMRLALGLTGELGQPWAFRSWIAFTVVPLVVYLFCSLFVIRTRTPDRGCLLALLAIVLVSLGLVVNPEASAIARATQALFMTPDPQTFFTGPLLAPEMAAAWARPALMWVIGGIVGLHVVSSTRREGPSALLRRRRSP